MEKLERVADAIFDAKEFLKENTKNADSVKAYAENGMNVDLTDGEAQAIRAALIDYLEHRDGKSLTWYQRVTVPLAKRGTAAALLKECDASGFATVAAGVFLESSASMQAQAASWADEDPARALDFAAYPYWLTTDSGTLPVGISGADDADLLDAIE